jgi:hypothetical protein
LPTNGCFYKSKPRLFGWPGGSHVKLKTLKKFHDEAYTRGNIEDYRDFRSILQIMCKQLIRSDVKSEQNGDRAKAVRNNIGRMQAQIKMLKPPPAKDLFKTTPVLTFAS